jgi:hypothetical protein
MHLQVFERYGMSTNHYRDLITGFYELLELPKARARRIANNQPGGQMNNLGSIFYHLFGHILNIASRAASTVRISHHLYWLILGVSGKTANPFSNCPKAFATSAALVATTDDNPDFLHAYLLFY